MKGGRQDWQKYTMNIQMSEHTVRSDLWYLHTFKRQLSILFNNYAWV